LVGRSGVTGIGIDWVAAVAAGRIRSTSPYSDAGDTGPWRGRCGSSARNRDSAVGPRWRLQVGNR